VGLSLSVTPMLRILASPRHVSAFVSHRRVLLYQYNRTFIVSAHAWKRGKLVLRLVTPHNKLVGGDGMQRPFPENPTTHKRKIAYNGKWQHKAGALRTTEQTHAITTRTRRDERSEKKWLPRLPKEWVSATP
jgi:hypothetical protein